MKDIIKEYLNRIYALKNELRKTDYQALKFAEGEITMSEYAEIKQQRKEWRAEINELEAKINALEGE